MSAVASGPAGVALEVLATGPLATIQDLGRPGHAAWGVGASGAADRASLRLGNRLVGNPEDAGAVEVTLGGLAVRALGDVLAALTGAPCPAQVKRRRGARTVAHNAVLTLDRGDELTLGPPSTGLRTYLAVRGGIDVAPVLGSRSTDVLAGLGPDVLTAPMRLPVGPPPPDFPCVDLAPVADPPSGDVALHVALGPRDDWFTPAALAALLTQDWTVTPDIDRVGMRLDGPELTRAVAGELPSEGVVHGALQVPPSGRPTLFLADHPVTGGYPVIAVVLDADVDRAAQARPGQRLHFRRGKPS
jgi:biotin-dependent carboxylase-like uncharacterized protein